MKKAAQVSRASISTIPAEDADRCALKRRIKAMGLLLAALLLFLFTVVFATALGSDEAPEGRAGRVL